VGDSYSIVDMAVWGWARMVPFVIGSSATDMSVWETYPNVKKLLDAVSARPAAARAIAIKDKYTFKTEMDDAARAVMFRHTVAA
jgi:GST-like protein